MRAPLDRRLDVRVRLIALIAVVPLLFGACGSEPPATAAPTVRPTPSPTPDPHLADPTTADAVYRGLAGSGLSIAAINASGGDGALVKQINATYAGWPLAVSEYRSTAALAKLLDWPDGKKPSRGEAPVAITGANIVVAWGPRTGSKPPKPDARQMEALEALTRAMDRLLSPLRARSVVPLAISTPSPTPDESAASPSGTSTEGATTPAP